MKAGEYVGKDGRTYRWTKQDSETGVQESWYRLEVVGGRYSEGPYVSDVPAAKAALDALIAAEQDAEWVELDSNGCTQRTRISRDGTLAQTRWPGDEWKPALNPDWSGFKAYRKGREVAEAENAALREQVRALVEAVKNAHIWRNETRSDTGPLEWPTAESWYEIKAASKAVQL